MQKDTIKRKIRSKLKISSVLILLDRSYMPIFNLTSAIFVARMFGAETVGALAIFFAVIPIGQVLVSWGTDQNLQITIASSQRQLHSNIVITQIHKRLLRGILIFICAVAPLVLLFEYSFVLLCSISGLLVGIISTCAMPQEIALVVGRKFLYLCIMKYICGVFSFCIILIALFVFSFDPIWILCVLLFERLTYFCLVYASCNFKNPAAPHGMPVAVPSCNMSVLVSTIAVYLYNRFDQIYLANQLSAYDLGIYFATLRVFEVANLFVVSMVSGKLYALADLNYDPALVARLEAKIFAVSVMIVMLLALTAPMVVRNVFGFQFDSWGLVAIFALSTLFGVLGAVKGPWVARNNRYKYNMAFTIAGAVVTLCYYLVLSPKTVEGVALGVAFGQFSVNILAPMLLATERRFLASVIRW